jgi:hypothetical protein
MSQGVKLFITLFTNHVFIALVSSTALLLMGALGKGMIKGHCLQNWYLGFDASLTAVFAAIVYLYDLARSPVDNLFISKLQVTAGFLVLSLVLFLVIVGCHQSWEKDDKKDRRFFQFIVLGVIANVLGFGLLIAFTFLVKGVS